jgi:hypothetical protein
VTARTPWATGWGQDSWSWNTGSDEDDEADGGMSGGCDGMPGLGLVSSVVSFWLEATPGASADDVAEVFNLPLHMADDAVSAAVGSSDLGTAIQVWSLLNAGETTIDTASTVLRSPPSVILQAVEEHPWMYLETRHGSLCIGHDGD